MPKTEFIIDRTSLARYKSLMARLGGNVMAPKRFLMAAGEVLMTGVEEAFRMERDPETHVPWKDLMDSTKAGRKKGRKKARHKVGALGISRGSTPRHAFASGAFKSGKNKGLAWDTGYKILQDSGILRASFRRQMSLVPPAVAVGSNVPYAKYHQSDSPRRSNLAQRRMLPTRLTPKMSAKLSRALIADIKARGVGQYVSGG